MGKKYEELNTLSGVKLSRPRHIWEENTDMNISKISCEDASSMKLAQNRVQQWTFLVTIMNLPAP
jgi:hypothetical protein